MTDCFTIDFRGAAYMRRARLHNLRVAGFPITRRTTIAPCERDRDCVRAGAGHVRIEDRA